MRSLKVFRPLWALLGCLAVALVLWILKPVPHGHRYDYAFVLSLTLAIAWLIYAANPTKILFRKAVLIPIFLCGLAFGVKNLATIRGDVELVRHYRDVFSTLESGKNPYTAAAIFHDAEFYKEVRGNFNYPPLEIYPYYLAYRTAGTWNVTVFTLTVLIIQAVAGIVFVLMFPRVRFGFLLTFLPMILVGEVKTGAAMTLLLTALILWQIKKDRQRPGGIHRYVIAVLFGLGLMTKFLIIPLMAAYYWHQFDRKRLRSLLDIAVDVSISLATAVLIMAPYGVMSVLKNTILFNLVLRDRAVLAIFFPGVLSGPMTWFGLESLYPVAAVAILGVAVLIAPRLSLFGAMLTAAYVFLLVAPTPELQFLPTIVLVIAAARFITIEETSPIVPRVWKPVPAVSPSRPS
jgi:hypothetical protein